MLCCVVHRSRKQALHGFLVAAQPTRTSRRDRTPLCTRLATSLHMHGSNTHRSDTVDFILNANTGVSKKLWIDKTRQLSGCTPSLYSVSNNYEQLVVRMTACKGNKSSIIDVEH